jgi:hypothetical protein
MTCQVFAISNSEKKRRLNETVPKQIEEESSIRRPSLKACYFSVDEIKQIGNFE